MSAAKRDSLKRLVRQAVADYMASEGCSCCRDVDGHAEHKKRLAKLLGVQMYHDKSGYDFPRFRSKPNAHADGLRASSNTVRRDVGSDFDGNAPESTRPSSAAPETIRAGEAADMSRSTAASLPSSNNRITENDKG